MCDKTVWYKRPPVLNLNIYIYNTVFSPPICVNPSQIKEKTLDKNHSANHLLQWNHLNDDPDSSAIKQIKKKNFQQFTDIICKHWSFQQIIKFNNLTECWMSIISTMQWI